MGVREMKNRLSEVVRAVRAGEHVRVTDRGTVVAELVAPGRPRTDPSLPAGLARLAERGAARLGAPNDPAVYQRSAAARRKPASVARLLDEERGSTVKLYAESSAPLAWLLEQEHGRLVADTLARAELVIASDLTVVECDRVLIRAVTLEELHESDAVDRRPASMRYPRDGPCWRSTKESSNGRGGLPVEPVRTLDAIHLASALTARKAVPNLAMLSLDARIRQAAERLGFTLAPTDAELEKEAEQPPSTFAVVQESANHTLLDTPISSASIRAGASRCLRERAWYSAASAVLADRDDEQLLDRVRLAADGGAETVTLLESEIPAHAHGISASTMRRSQDEIRIVDIALLAEFCNRGIGTTLLRGLQSEAAAAGKPLRIHVERFNPALRLYERLGFRQIDDRGVSVPGVDRGRT